MPDDKNQRMEYVHRYPFGEHELYDLSADPEEKENLYGRAEYESTVEHLRQKLYEWFTKYADPRLDASREPVRGNGQLCRSGIYAKGKIAFDQNRKRHTDPDGDPGRNG